MLLNCLFLFFIHLTLASLNLALSSPSTTSCELDEDDLKCMANEENTLYLLKQFHENFRSKIPRCRKLDNSSEMQNNSLLHHEGLKG